MKLFFSRTKGMRIAHMGCGTTLALALCGINAVAQQLVDPSPAQQKMFSRIAESESAAVSADSAVHPGHSSADVSSSLPDAPSSVIASAEDPKPVSFAPKNSDNGMQAPGGRIAPRYSKFIDPGFQAQKLTTGDKFILTARDLYTPESFFGFVAAAGYSQITNGQPNFGTDSGAFGQRLYAAAIRDTSQDIFASAIFASVFHEDPRYYVEGDSYNVVHRTAYAITRPFITRGDNGRNRLNTSLLLGYLAAASLTTTYYPKGNRNAEDVARTYGSSIGGAAAGFMFQEFIGDVMDAIHHHKQQPTQKNAVVP